MAIRRNIYFCRRSARFFHLALSVSLLSCLGRPRIETRRRFCGVNFCPWRRIGQQPCVSRMNRTPLFSPPLWYCQLRLFFCTLSLLYAQGSFSSQFHHVGSALSFLFVRFSSIHRLARSLARKLCNYPLYKAAGQLSSVFRRRYLSGESDFTGTTCVLMYNYVYFEGISGKREYLEPE